MESMNILICEDEHLIAVDLGERLKAHGHNVIGIASNEERAFELIEQEKPDLAIMDVHLDNGTLGTDIARTIAHQYQVPSVFLTADDDEATVEESKGPLSLGYLLKPVRDSELMCTIELAMNRHRYYQNLCHSMYGGVLRDTRSSVSVADVTHSLAEAFMALTQHTSKAEVLSEDARVIERSIYQLLCANGTGSYQMDWFSAKDLMGKMMAGIRTAFPEVSLHFNATSEMEMVMDSLSLYGDVSALQFALLQIVKNAYEAQTRSTDSDVTEPIEIHTNLEFRRQVGQERPEWHYVIYIVDNGSGILQVKEVDVFTPYVTSKDETGHLGLGLPIASQIVQDHNGFISLASDSKKGARAAVYLALSRKVD